MRIRRLATVGMVGAVAALTVLTAGPAGAVIPASVAAGTPSWSSSQLKAAGSFKNSATVAATYSYTLQLVRTSTASKPVCTTAGGCPTSGTTQVLLNKVTSSVSVAKSSTYTLPTLAVNCAAGTTTRYYWSWLTVADSSGNVVTSVSSYIAGKYC